MEEENKKEFTKEEIIKLLAIFIVLSAMLIYSIFSSNDNVKRVGKKVKNENIIALFEPIKDNYSLTINRLIDDKEEKIEFITDGNFKLYNIDDQENGYLIYSRKTYNVESKGFKIKEYTKELDFVNDCYSDLDFLKSILVYCDLFDVSYNEVKCNMRLSDYVNGFNNYYYMHYVYDGDEVLTFDIKYDNVINSIKVDYSNANKIIKNSNNKVIYDMSVSNVNGNDYSNLFEVFKDTLKK